MTWAVGQVVQPAGFISTQKRIVRSDTHQMGYSKSLCEWAGGASVAVLHEPRGWESVHCNPTVYE